MLGQVGQYIHFPSVKLTMSRVTPNSKQHRRVVGDFGLIYAGQLTNFFRDETPRDALTATAVIFPTRTQSFMYMNFCTKYLPEIAGLTA